MGDTPNIDPKTRPLFGLALDGTPLQCPIIGLCGAKGSGKTLAGLTLCPEETIEIGIEDSGVTYNLPLKQRFSMYKEVTGKDGGIPKPIDCWTWFAGIVDKIAKGELKCRVLVVDPITDIQSGLVEWVKANAQQFGRTATQYEKASGLLWADVKAHAKMLLGKISTKCVFIFTAHMGSVWAGGAPVAGKTKSKGMDTFYELASLYVYLTRDVDPATGQQPKEPVGYVCPPHGKTRLAHSVFNPETGEFDITPILPPRIPKFTWAELRKYVAKPPDFAKLKKDERGQVETLSADDKLILEHDRARMELEAAQLRQQQLELAQSAAAKTSAVLTQAAQTGAAKAAVPAQTAPAKTEAPKTEPPKPEAKPEAKPEPKPEPKQEEQPFVFTRENCIKTILEQQKQLGEDFGPTQLANACKKRGAESGKLEDLTDDKLEDLRKALWTVLSKRGLALHGQQPPKK